MTYRPQAADTPRDAEEMLFDAYRRMSAAEKLERAGRLGQLVKSVVIADLRQRHPGATERELQLRYASRLFDPQTMRAAFGWAPDDDEG